MAINFDLFTLSVISFSPSFSTEMSIAFSAKGSFGLTVSLQIIHVQDITDVVFMGFQQFCFNMLSHLIKAAPTAIAFAFLDFGWTEINWNSL